MNEHLKAWLEALRSGKYHQGKSGLVVSEHGHTVHCCLGVLCEVDPNIKKVGRGFSLISRDKTFYSLPPTEAVESLGLPEQMIVKALKSGSGTIVIPFERFSDEHKERIDLRFEIPENSEISVHSLNDHGYFTFREIADAVETAYNYYTNG